MMELNNAWDMYERIVQKDEESGLFDIYYQISKAIFKYRVSENLTQKALAKKLGITQAMVSKLESGLYNYSLEQLWKIARKLGLDFSVKFEKNLNTNWNVDSNEGQSMDYILEVVKAA